MKILRYIIGSLLFIVCVLLIIIAGSTTEKANAALSKADKKIKEHVSKTAIEELETVSTSYEKYLEQKETETNITYGIDNYGYIEDYGINETETEYEVVTEPKYSEMDVWTLGRELYGIPDYDTTRSLILITFEGYGPESPLSYYVACCCWTRATNGYLGFDNLYSAFGGADVLNYGEWLDNNGYADYAIEVLRQAYLSPMYIMNCNGMETPENYIYYENGIYVWN